MFECLPTLLGCCDEGKGREGGGEGGGVEHELDSDLSQQLGAATWSASRGK